jgi:hypothetical protein
MSRLDWIRSPAGALNVVGAKREILGIVAHKDALFRDRRHGHRRKAFVAARNVENNLAVRLVWKVAHLQVSAATNVRDPPAQKNLPQYRRALNLTSGARQKVESGTGGSEIRFAMDRARPQIAVRRDCCRRFVGGL